MTAPQKRSQRSPTVLDNFRDNVRQWPERAIYTYVDDRGQDRDRLTFEQVQEVVDRLAGFLIHDHGLKVGDRVLLVYPPSLNFVSAFIACLYVGLVPVPVAPPNPFRLRGDLSGFESAAESSGSIKVLTDSTYLRLKRLAAAKNLFVAKDTAWSRLPWVRTDTVPDRDRPPVTPYAAEVEDLAFLQYTSGSTSAPKGVMISHANIMHQMAINDQSFGLHSAARSVMWIPHFHDFCLVGGILSALYGNGFLYLMSPLAFLRRPHVWFEALSRIRATHTAAPDFAYRLSVRKTTPEQRRSWDLSSMRVVASAAEPVRPSTVDTFVEAFAESKLEPEAFCPAYGLAEHTVGVTQAGRRRLRVDRRRLELDGVAVETDDPEPHRALDLVGCGAPFGGVDVRIVDPETRRERGEGKVGEIWVDSPSKAMGYFGLPELSREVFEARLEDSEEGRAYLRTGDLAFQLGDELYVAGRLKDLVIVRGRNLYPQDLEESVYSSHASIRPGRAVAFSVPAEGRDLERGDGESVVVLAEIAAKKAPAPALDEVVQAVRGRLQRDHRVAAHAVLIAPPGEILKTTSGKLRRAACRQAYLDGEFKKLLRQDVRGG